MEKRIIKFRAWHNVEGLRKMYYLTGFLAYGEGWKGGNPDHKFYELYFDEEEINDFEPCEDCDLPDACADFECEIKAGIKEPSNW